MALLVWLPFNKSDDFIINRGIGINTTIYNAGATYSTLGKLGGCASFSNGQYVVLLNLPSFSNEISIAFWMNPTVVSTLTLINYRTDVGSDLALFLYEGKLRFDIGGVMNSLDYSYVSNAWNHICVTYNRQKIILYVNGIETYSTPLTAAINITATSGTIGMSSVNTTTGYGNQFVGYLNDYRIYNHALSLREVHDIYKSLLVHYSLNNPINYFDMSSAVFSYSETASCNNLPYGLTGVIEGDVVKIDGTNFLDTNEDGTARTNVSWHFLNHPLITDVELSSDTEAQKAEKHRKRKLFIRKMRGIGEAGIRLYEKVVHDVNISDIDIDFVNVTKGFYAEFQIAVYDKDSDCNIYIPYNADYRTIIDDSGYRNNGTLVLNTSYKTYRDAPRYGYSMYLGTSDRINGVGLPTIATPFTVSFWYKPDTELTYRAYADIVMFHIKNTYSNTVGLLRLENNGTDYTKTYTWWGNVCIDPVHLDVTLGEGEKNAGWHHFVLVYENNAFTGYRDNVFKKTSALSANNLDHFFLTGNFVIGDAAAQMYGQWSDFRFYATALSREDIAELYHTSAYVTDNKTAAAFSMNEVSLYNGNVTDVDINYLGVLSAPVISELPIPVYDAETYIEPDNSVWVRIMHHNNPSANRFASTDTFTEGVYKSADVWFDMAFCNQLTQWEFMVKQKATSTTATESKYRWKQNEHPFTASFASTTAANVTKVTTSGYTNNTSFGGLFPGKRTNCFLVANNGNASDWWGATGCWTLYGVGMPGYAQVMISTGYMDIYIRIDNVINNYVGINPNGLSAKNITEI